MTLIRCPPCFFKQKRATLSLTHHETCVRAGAHEICIIFTRRPDTSPLCFWVNSDRRAPSPPLIFPKGVGGRFINSPLPLPPSSPRLCKLIKRPNRGGSGSRQSLVLRPVWTTCDPKSCPSGFQTRRQTGAFFLLSSKCGCQRVDPPVGALFRLGITGSNCAPSIQGFDTINTPSVCLPPTRLSRPTQTGERVWR